MTDIDPATIAKQLAVDGYAIVPNVIDGAFRAELDHEIERLIASSRVPMPPNYFSGFKTLRYFDLLNEGSVWALVATHTLVLDIVFHVLGRDCLLSVLCTALVNPEQKAQPIHCDDDIYELPRPHPHLVLNTIWAINDFEENNGATRIVPGSHLFDAPPAPDATYQTIPLEMKRGSIAFILGTTFHGAGANMTRTRRDAIIVNYCAGIMRQQENFMLEVSRDTARTFTPTLQRLIGYGLTRAGAGRVDYSNPEVLLRNPSRPGRSE